MGDCLTCASNEYLKTDKTCAPCNYQCLTCQGSHLNCFSCSHGTRTLNKNPKCKCNDTFYDDGSNAACIACSYPCVNCSDSNTCITCASGLNREEKPSCSCNSGYWDDEPVCTGNITTIIIS